MELAELMLLLKELQPELLPSKVTSLASLPGLPAILRSRITSKQKLDWGRAKKQG